MKSGWCHFVQPGEEDTEGGPHCSLPLPHEGERRGRLWFLLHGDQWQDLGRLSEVVSGEVWILRKISTFSGWLEHQRSGHSTSLTEFKEQLDNTFRHMGWEFWFCTGPGSMILVGALGLLLSGDSLVTNLVQKWEFVKTEWLLAHCVVVGSLPLPSTELNFQAFFLSEAAHNGMTLCYKWRCKWVCFMVSSAELGLFQTIFLCNAEFKN